MRWRPHTEIPDGPQTAVVAIRPPKDDPDDVDAILLAEVQRWDTHFRCWMGESNGLKLKHAIFWWMPEGELLMTLPSLP